MDLLSFYRSLLLRYRITIQEMDKHVLVDEDMIKDLLSELRNPCFVFPFPGTEMRVWGKEGVFYEEGEFREVLNREFPGWREGWGEEVYVYPRLKEAREKVGTVLERGFKRGVIVVRGTVAAEMVAEPGWAEYSPLSVLTQGYYNAEGFVLPSEAFDPPPPYPMGAVVLERKREVKKGVKRILEVLFRKKNKKLAKVGKEVGIEYRGGEKVFEVDPDTYAELLNGRGENNMHDDE